MAETADIAAMAERLSGELFAEFFWKRTGPMNENWACERPEHHKVKTHPSDVVFYYDEPYTQQRTYPRVTQFAETRPFVQKLCSPDSP